VSGAAAPWTAPARTPRGYPPAPTRLESGERLFSTTRWGLAYSPDGRWLPVRDADENSVAPLGADSHETDARFRGHEWQAVSAAFSPDSRRLASCSQNRTIRLWQIDGGECQVLRGHTD
jgi:WD40 repeat protein